MAMLQVRGVPDDIYATVKERAAARGISVSEYVRGLLARDARLAPLDEFLVAVRRHGEPPTDTVAQVQSALRELRDHGE